MLQLWSFAFFIGIQIGFFLLDEHKPITDLAVEILMYMVPQGGATSVF